MGTKIHCKSYLPGFYSMRNLNEDSSSSSWPLFYGDKTIPNGQYYNGFMPRTLVDGYPGHDKDALKQKILEHEAVFKNQFSIGIQVCELHRLYRIQRDMMGEAKRKELYKHRESMEPASSSSLQGSQMPSGDGRKWHMAGFPLLNSTYGRTSMSGVEIVNSPTSCTKGYNTTQPGQFPFQNGFNSKDSEAFDSRPSKVRKKLFDLQLPADEYIDDEEVEKLPDYKASSVKGSIGLADLNEPIQIEDDAMAPSSADFLGQPSENVKDIKGKSPHAKYGFLINSNIESKVNESGLLSHIYEAGAIRSNFSPVTQGCRQDKLLLPSHPLQGMLNQVHQPPGIYPSGYSREELWKEGPRNGLESSDKSRDHSNNTPGSYPFFSSSCFASSWAHSVSPWANPTNGFPQKVTTLETSLNSAAATSRSWHGFYHASSSGSKELQVQLPSASFDYLNCSRADNIASDRSTNHVFGNFPKGSSHADSKPTIDINLNEKSPSNEVVPMQDLNKTDGQIKHEDHLSALPWLKPKPSHVTEVANDRRSEIPEELSYLHAASNQSGCKNEMVRDLNLLFTPKVMLAASDAKIERRKDNAETQTVKKILGFPIFERGVQENEMSSLASTSASVGCHHEGKNVKNERKNGIIDINVACEPDELIAAEEPTVEKETHEKGASVRDHIDLNSCVSDSDDPPPPCYERESTNVKITLEIDLEVPLFIESEDDNTPSKENMPDKVPLQSLENKNEQTQDVVLRDAAEAIVAISSTCPQIHIDDDSICQPSEASLAESLLWFVDALSSYENELENTTSGKESRIRDGSPHHDSSEDDIDDFEAMTLQLAETKEEDYMPKPFVPEVQKVEDTGGNALQTRSRRGQSRRGRQRRDFQRDILPGLASLSRHEVTEDLQTFGGLMRATGHSWTSGLTRRNGTRNGGGRGRRRAVVETVPSPIPSPVCSTTPLIQQLNNIEAGLEDRSLTGWGKTTRRPRRQRCPAGNPPTVALT